MVGVKKALMGALVKVYRGAHGELAIWEATRCAVVPVVVRLTSPDVEEVMDVLVVVGEPDPSPKIEPVEAFLIASHLLLSVTGPPIKP